MISTRVPSSWPRLVALSLPVVMLLGCGGGGGGGSAPANKPSRTTRVAADGPVRSVLLAPDGASVWVWSEDTSAEQGTDTKAGILRQLKLEDLSELAKVEGVGQLRAIGKHQGNVAVVTDVVESKVSGHHVEIRSVPGGEVLATLRNATNVAISPDGEQAIVDIGPCRFARRRITDLKDKLEFRAGKPSRLPPATLFAVRKQGTTMVVADREGFVQVVDWSTGEPVVARKAILQMPESYAVNDSVTLIAAGTQRGPFAGIKVWDPEKQSDLHAWKMTEPTTNVMAMTFLDDSRLVFADAKGRLLLWELGKAEPRSIYEHSDRVVSLVGKGNKLLVLDSRGDLFVVSAG